jgi:hypothetical protein
MMLLRSAFLLFLWRYLRPILPVVLLGLCAAFLVAAVQEDIVAYAKEVADAKLLMWSYWAKWIALCVIVISSVIAARARLRQVVLPAHDVSKCDALDEVDRALVNKPVWRSKGDLLLAKAKANKSVMDNKKEEGEA